MAGVLAMDELSTFLKAAAGRSFRWGQWDCLQWLGFWIEARRGVNPAASWVGTYATTRQAHRIVRDAGGMAAHMDAVLTPASIFRTDEPRRGDIALVRAPEGELGAIVTGEFTACIGPGGLRFRKVPILTAWRV